MISVGETIPQDLEVEVYHNNEIKKIKFDDYKDKWLVLIFYPADFTFICPTELGEVANLYEQFQKEGAEVLSVSTDTVYVHKAWHDKSPIIKKIQFPMIADPTGKLCQIFGTYIKEEGISLRASLIIDPDGILKVVEMHDNNIGRNVNEILRKLQAVKFVREHDGEVCPASWTPGSETLKPGLDLVGEI